MQFFKKLKNAMQKIYYEQNIKILDKDSIGITNFSYHSVFPV